MKLHWFIAAPIVWSGLSLSPSAQAEQLGDLSEQPIGDFIAQHGTKFHDVIVRDGGSGQTKVKSQIDPADPRLIIDQSHPPQTDIVDSMVLTLTVCQGVTKVPPWGEDEPTTKEQIREEAEAASLTIAEVLPDGVSEADDDWTVLWTVPPAHSLVCTGGTVSVALVAPEPDIQLPYTIFAGILLVVLVIGFVIGRMMALRSGLRSG